MAISYSELDAMWAYRWILSKNDVFKRLCSSVASLDLPGNLHTRDVLIDLLKIKKNVLIWSQSALEGVNTDVQIIREEELQKISSSYKVGWEREALNASYSGNIFDIPLETTSMYAGSIYHIECRVAAYRKRLFSYIKIGTPNYPICAEAVYVHELVHALIKRSADSLSNPLFDEYMSRVLELLYLYFSKDSLFGFKCKCIESLYECQTSSEEFDDMKYLVSDLLAFITLEQFLEFSPKDRDEMFGKIRKVLNCQMTIENFLCEYDFNLETDRSATLVNRMIDRIHI